jgi:hypothetical protein
MQCNIKQRLKFGCQEISEIMGNKIDLSRRRVDVARALIEEGCYTEHREQPESKTFHRNQ